jgi:hypothetical protein
MEITILTALISALVSLVVALITVLASRGTIRSEREKLERELQRNMTSRLYEVRLESYPKAMEITEGLRKEHLEKQDKNLSQEYIRDILNQLDAWHATKAGFIISRKSLCNLYALREALQQKPEFDDKYSPEQIKRIWNAKNEFRATLRADIQLLFKEDGIKEIKNNKDD